MKPELTIPSLEERIKALHEEIDALIERQVDISAANVTAIPRETLRRCLVGRAGGCRCEEYRLIRKKEEAEEALRIRQNEETLRAG
jgi:putative N-acetylmannosamine-6-phosphate epimerase